MDSSQWIGLLVACGTLIPLAAILYFWLRARHAESILASAALALVMAVAASLLGGAVLVAVGAAVIRLGGWGVDFQEAYDWLDSVLALPVPVAAFGSLLLFNFLGILAIRANRRKQTGPEADSSLSSSWSGSAPCASRERGSA